MALSAGGGGCGAYPRLQHYLGGSHALRAGDTFDDLLGKGDERLYQLGSGAVSVPILQIREKYGRKSSGWAGGYSSRG